MYRRKPQSETSAIMGKIDSQAVLSQSKHVLAASFYGMLPIYNSLFSLSLTLAFVSISTMFVNKAVLTVYGFEYTNFILLAQHLFTVVALYLFRKLGLVHFPDPEISKCKQVCVSQHINRASLCTHPSLRCLWNV